MRKNFIEEHETFVTREQFDGGKPFLGESPFFGRSYKVTDLLNEFGDQVQRIFRINTESMASEDVTEEVARQWLYRADNEEFGLDDERLFPAYVRNSKAWACWQADTAPAFFSIGHSPEARLERHFSAE